MNIERSHEEANIGRPNWEHLNDKLHVLITIDDYENRAKIRLEKASQYISQFLQESIKVSDKDDHVKLMQSMELSILRKESLPFTWPVNFTGLPKLDYSSKRNPIFTKHFKSLNIGHNNRYLPRSYYISPAIQHSQQYFLPFSSSHGQNYPQLNQQQQQLHIDIPTSQPVHNPNGFTPCCHHHHYQNNNNLLVFPSPSSSDLSTTMYLHRNTTGSNDFTGYYKSTYQQTHNQTPSSSLSNTLSVPVTPLTVNCWSCTYSGLTSSSLSNYPSIQQTSMNHAIDIVTGKNQHSCNITPGNYLSPNCMNNYCTQSNYDTATSSSSLMKLHLPFHGKQLVTSSSSSSNITSQAIINTKHIHQKANTNNDSVGFRKKSQKCCCSGDQSTCYYQSDEHIRNTVTNNDNHSHSISALNRNTSKGVKKYYSEKCNDTTSFTTTSSSKNSNKNIVNENVVITTRSTTTTTSSSSSSNRQTGSPTVIVKINTDDNSNNNNNNKSINSHKSMKNHLTEQEQLNQCKYATVTLHDECKKLDFKSTIHQTTNYNHSSQIDDDDDDEDHIITTATTTSTIHSVSSRNNQTLHRNKNGFSKNSTLNTSHNTSPPTTTTTITSSTRKLSKSNLKPIGLVTDEAEWPKLGTNMTTTSANSLQTSIVANCKWSLSSSSSLSMSNVVVNGNGDVDADADSKKDDQLQTLSHNSNSIALDHHDTLKK
ncbi:unnamed protein product [Schistosoma turkestanicum]|nr:unnamed protein product [Schistosoma turkestanicum]CAH8545347.1 unnamed protein product [Schistosoma turkestanicum]